MKDKLLLVITVSVISVLLAVSPVSAASSQFISKAQKYADKTCSARNVSNQSSLLCYLYEKIKEHDAEITILKNKNADQEIQINNLKERIDDLETAPIPTATPTSSPSPTQIPTPTP